MTVRIGVDSGGTFTDICLMDDATGEVKIWKVSSTPSDPSDGIIEALARGLEAVGKSASEVSFFGHGTTVGTNALIQHRGAATGLITSDGFHDLLEIGRQKRPDLFDMMVDKPEPLVSRDLRKSVPERMLHDGRIATPLDEEALRLAARGLKAAGVQSIAVCFLYGYAFPAHEQRARAILVEEFPEAFISTSHEVSPEFREFERVSSTVVNAYLGPVMKSYIDRLRLRLTDFGLLVVPHITQSNGGVLGFSTAADYPVRTILSGPSTGVVAAQAIGLQAGFPNLITFDVGGTSSDVALITGGVCGLTTQADVEGYPIRAPMLDIHTVGAGGGSIAHVDNGGLLKVGPRSAGADPGPVCYDRGNTEPTVTDANVVLQTLNPDYLLGGRMKINQELSRTAIAAMAEKLGMSTMETAEGILSVVIANMAKAIRVISVQRGYDPREYALIAFGGAGPLHAARLARELEIGRVLIPLTPGALCATGLLLTDLRADFALTDLMQLTPDAAAAIAANLGVLEARANAWFDAEEVGTERRRLNRSIDIRYRGQNYEIAIPVAEGAVTADTLDAIGRRFAEEHRRAYGFAADDPVELVTFRLEAISVVNKVRQQPRPETGPDCAMAIIGHRPVWMSGAAAFVECPVYDRDRLDCGNRFDGPAIVEQMDTTTVVPPGASVHVDAFRNLVMELGQ